MAALVFNTSTDVITTGLPTTSIPATTPVPSPGKWKENSDFVARYKDFYDRLLSQPPAISSTSVPAEVLARLNGTNLQWSSLNTFAQQALIWDSGFVRAAWSDNAWVRVYTQCASTTNRSSLGATTANIAITAENLDADGKSCENTEGDEYERLTSLSLGATPYKCALPTFLTSRIANSSVWSQDALASTTVPDLSVQLHRSSPFVAAIHASPVEEPSADQCPATDGALVIPCAPYAAGVGWCLPAPSKTMATWLSNLQTLASRTTRTPSPSSGPSNSSPSSAPQVSGSDSSAPSAISTSSSSKGKDIAVICVGGAFGLAAIIIGVCFMRWFHRKLQSMLESSYVPISTPSQRHLPINRDQV
ncbi:hypothetical protein AC1031_003893 [Aphanomyces cochlioides]|nr:hypothetical protein AC1031_003893 [Aphanomyces cochlioides]